MDRRSINSKYEFSESDSDSVHSSHGLTARTISMARHVISVTSLRSLRTKTEVTEITPQRLIEPRATVSLLSFGKEHDYRVEVVTEPLTDPFDDNEPITRPSTAAGMTFEEWRHSSLLPLPAGNRNYAASSIYSQETRGRPAGIDSSASSIHSQESCGTQRNRTVLSRQLVRKALSIRTLASSIRDDASSIYSRYDSALQSTAAETPSRDDASSIYSRKEDLELPDQIASPKSSTYSLFPSSLRTATSAYGSGNQTPTSPSPKAQQTWLLPPTRDGPAREGPSTVDSSEMRVPEQKAPSRPQTSRSRAATTGSESAFRVSDAESTISPISPQQRRPSSWSWLSLDTDTLSSDGSSSPVSPTHRTSSMLRGLRTLSPQGSSSRSSMAKSRLSDHPPPTPPPRYSGLYERQGSIPERPGSCAPPPSPTDGILGAEGQDPLQLPALQLPDLPDERKVAFYVRCGHLETLPWMISAGPELPGWCPQCSKRKRGKRKVVKRELKSMLRSIAE